MDYQIETQSCIKQFNEAFWTYLPILVLTQFQNDNQRQGMQIHFPSDTSLKSMDLHQFDSVSPLLSFIAFAL